VAEAGIYDPAEARATGDVCLRCSEPSGYQYVVSGGGYLCPPCCALVDPDRFLLTANEVALEFALAEAPRSDEEWEALGWRPPPVASLDDHRPKAEATDQ